jgi:hypothetical protein
VIQINKQYQKNMPCRDGPNCTWVGRQEGCRYLHGHSTNTLSQPNSEMFHELISLVEARLTLRDQEREKVRNVESSEDFPNLENRKRKPE